MIGAARARNGKVDSKVTRAVIQNRDRKIGEVGGKAWVYNADSTSADSYQHLAAHMDSLGESLAATYTGGKRDKYTPGQHSAHAALLAFKGKHEKLQSEYGVKPDQLDQLYKHTSVLMGAEVGRTPLAGVSNFLMLHSMKHTEGSSFTRSLTGVQQGQLKTQKTVMDEHTFLSAPYGSIGMMDSLQASIDSFPDNPTERFSKKGSMGDTWEKAIQTHGKSFKVPLPFAPREKIKSTTFSAQFLAKGVDGDKSISVALPSPLDLANNEAQRLKTYATYKALKHTDRKDPMVALRKGVLKHFQPKPATISLSPKVHNQPTLILPSLASTHWDKLPSTVPSAPLNLQPDATTGLVKLFDIRRQSTQSRPSL